MLKDAKRRQLEDSDQTKKRKLQDRPGWMACRGCPANFTPLRNLLEDLQQHATADTRWYLFSYDYELFNLDHGGVESRILTRIKDGRSRDGDDEGTPVELSDMYCIKCGMHAGWQIVSEYGNEPSIYAEKCILLSEW
ncbi:uncharacterized protein LOC109123026 isoform X2 [Vitis vinifera]|uniref:uncharacterized protein LOC109123026 isoform X2 n=1 Tax=Vitis vinifera TaxID=29760 RepID=UPI0008FFDE9C|nr:uncharacterized protein LOC109123026 isoform X2 [Vitis vinifera]|eukprot:XP_019077171.1 PREDICTED: uncharacterized protein LOC109123026 isoform X2 [Vitis vinifera]